MDLWRHAYRAQYGVDPDQEIATLTAQIDEWRVRWQAAYDTGEAWATAMVADIPKEPPVDVQTLRENILRIAAIRKGLPYQLDPPPDGVTTIDCSLYVLVTYRDAGIPFPSGVRTAEQIRQACTPIGWPDVKAGDLIFFEHTYEPSEPAGPDGHTASHIGISLGAGTGGMWNAVNDGVQLTNVHTQYWQDHALEARQAPALVTQPGATTGTITDEPDHQFTLGELYPTMQAECAKTGFDPQVMAGVCYQESSFKNYRVHFDGTGHGLFGLDDGGMLPDFEQWSGLSVGRGDGAISIPPTLQIAYVAMALQRYVATYGDKWAACRAWHRGGGAMNDELGQRYEQLIRAHVQRLFA